MLTAQQNLSTVARSNEILEQKGLGKGMKSEQITHLKRAKEKNR